MPELDDEVVDDGADNGAHVRHQPGNPEEVAEPSRLAVQGERVVAVARNQSENTPAKKTR